MILDALLTFTGGTVSPGNSDGKTDSPTTGTQQSSNTVDIGLGTTANPGIPSPANGGGARDLGIGDHPSLKLSIIVTTAFVGGTSIQLTLDGAPDGGAGTPGSFTTMWTSSAVLEANLTVGTYLANIDVPRPIPGQVRPRFLRLSYVTVGTHSSGALEGQIVIDRFDQPVGTTGILGGYPAGVNVAN